jgi:glycosyltransferase involved in cell wall biosynthesis
MTQKKKTKETFIVVMPSFNEEERIEKTIRSWAKIIDKVPGSEILIIDGSSTDRTPKIIQRLQKEFKFLKLINKKREGYGKDLIHGYKIALKSAHDWIFQTDADSPFNIKDFFKLWSKRHTSPFIIARRYKRRDVRYRIVLAWAIELWIAVLFNKKIKDANIPFRLIRQKYLKNILNLIPQNTIAPNLFLTIIASRDGHDLHHIPVEHYFRNNSQNSSRLLKGAIKGFFELTMFALTL